MHNHETNSNQTDVLSVDLNNIWLCLRLHKMLLLMCVVASVSLASVYLAFFRVESYKAEVVLKMAASAPSSALSTLLASLNASENASAKLEALNEILNSTEFGEALADRAYHHREFFLEFTHTEGIKPKFAEGRHTAAQGQEEDLDEGFKERLVSRLTADLQFKPDQHSSTLSIFARTPKPWLSVELADLAAKSIVALNYDRKMHQITSLKKFLTKQLEDNGDKLNAFEASLAEHQRTHGLLNEAGAGNPTIVRYTKVQEDYEETKRLIAANADRIKINEHELEEFRSHLGDPTFYKSNVYLTQLQYRMRTLAYELDLAKSTDATTASTASDAETLKSELETLGKTYRDALNKSASGKNLPVASPTEYFQDLEKGLTTLKNEKSLLLARYRRAQEDLKSVKTDADLLPEQMRDYASLKRNITVTSTIFVETEKKLQEVRFMEAETINDLSVLYRAKTPEEPDNFSMLRLFAIMGVFGFAIGILLVLKIEVFGQTIRSKGDMEKACDQFLGVVPRIEPDAPSLRPRDLKPSFKSLKDSLINVSRYSNELILETSPDGEDADNFRSLRMHLFKLLKEDDAIADAKCKVIMITSPTVNSGRTFMAANLALTLAKADLKVLLVDLDLRKPDLYEFFPKCVPSDAQQGFKASHLSKCIQKYSSYLDVLLLRGQTSHPPEILESHEIQDFFKNARESYDFVIFDSPAVLSAVDPVISSSLADLVVMTVESQKTRHEEFAGALRKIRSCNNRPIYGVLNFSDRRRDAAA